MNPLRLRLRRLIAMVHARNLEFMRDRTALGWSVMLPVLLVFGFAFIFSGNAKEIYKVGVVGNTAEAEQRYQAFFNREFIQFIAGDNMPQALEKLKHHRLDMVVKIQPEFRYWVNALSPKGEVLEHVLHGTVQTSADIAKGTVEGRQIRYVDWVAPGIFATNMMFNCLFGVGYVVVRYRKNGMLKRLKATPLTPLEFLSAQVASRWIVIMLITVCVYIGSDWFIRFNQQGSYLLLLLVFALGAVCLISIGLIMAARTKSEEFASGMLNLISWPMMLLSGVWFSLEGSPAVLQWVSWLFPLTHMVEAARAVMNDGASILAIQHHLWVLVAMSVVFMAVGAKWFRWD